MEEIEKELAALRDQIKEATGKEQKKLFLTYCARLIELKEEGILSIEDAAVRMVNFIQYDNLSESPELAPIFDIAGDAELPREQFYAQPREVWNKETADQTKEQEWKDLVAAVESAERVLGGE